MKDADIGSLVEGPHPRHAEAIRVDPANRLAKGQHAVEQVQRQAQNLAGVGVGAMMRVMEERAEAQPRLARQYLLHHLRRIPLVNQHQVGARQFVIEKRRQRRVAAVEANVELRIGAVELVDRPEAASPSRTRLLSDHPSISS